MSDTSEIEHARQVMAERRLTIQEGEVGETQLQSALKDLHWEITRRNAMSPDLTCFHMRYFNPTTETVDVTHHDVCGADAREALIVAYVHAVELADPWGSWSN